MLSRWCCPFDFPLTEPRCCFLGDAPRRSGNFAGQWKTATTKAPIFLSCSHWDTQLPPERRRGGGHWKEFVGPSNIPTDTGLGCPQTGSSPCIRHLASTSLHETYTRPCCHAHFTDRYGGCHIRRKPAMPAHAAAARSSHLNNSRLRRLPRSSFAEHLRRNTIKCSQRP